MFNSFDIFDTLMGRICFSGLEIFEIIEKKYCIDNFKNIRQKCETKGIDNIYKNIKKYYENIEKYINNNIDWDEIKNYELKLEYDLSFPINKYLDLVKPYDILVSDMYLEENNIKKILNKHRTICNKLFVETGHKHDCTFWKSYSLVSNINMHYGDNKLSDYLNPIQFNIQATFIDNVIMNDVELKINQINKYFGFLIRACRLTNQNNNFINKIFNEISLPLGILVCLYLNIICKNNNIEHIVFISRDGYWFKYIYNILYPEFSTSYFYLSMHMVKNNNYGDSIEIIRKINKKKIIFDLFGTGNTITNFINIINDNNTIGFMTFNHHKSSILTIQNIAYKYMQYIDYVESLFPAPHQSVLGYDENNNILFKDLEYELWLLKDFMIGIETFKKYYNDLNNNINILEQSKYELESLRIIIFYMLNIGKHSFIKEIHNYINDNKLPEKNYNYVFTNIEIKYYIENISKFECNNTYLSFTNKNYYDLNYLTKYLNWKGFEYKNINNFDLIHLNIFKSIDLIIIEYEKLELVKKIINLNIKIQCFIIIEPNDDIINILTNNNYILINKIYFVLNM